MDMARDEVRKLVTDDDYTTASISRMHRSRRASATIRIF